MVSDAMSPAEFQAYLVRLAMEAYDGMDSDAFRARVTERMAQAAMAYACEIDIAQQASAPSPATHEMLAVALEEMSRDCRLPVPNWREGLTAARELTRVFAALAGEPYDENQPSDEEMSRREAEEAFGNRPCEQHGCVRLATETIEGVPHCGPCFDSADDGVSEDSMGEPYDEPGDIDGDAAGALASAGMGVDEDYE